MVLVAESRHLLMSDAISHPLGPLPWTLANADGTMRKTNKAALASELEKHVLQAEPIPEPSVTITDIINLVQKTKGNDQTFSQLADSAPTPSYMKESGVVASMWSSIRIAKTRSITQIDQTGGALHEYSSETWRQVTGSSNGEGFSAARPIRPTSMFLVAKWKTSKLREKLNDKQLYVASKDT